MRRGRQATTLIAVAVTLGVLLSLSTVATAAAVAPGTNGRLAFLKPQGGIATVNPDGTGLASVVSSGDGPESCAKNLEISPTGTQIAYSSDCDLNVYLVNADGTNARRLTNANPRNVETYTPDSVSNSDPTLSPDGNTVVFSTKRAPHVNDSVYELYAMNIDGSNARPLMPPDPSYIAFDSQPTFSGDGKRIAYVHGSELWVVNSDGSNRRKVVDAAPGTDRTLGRPSFSPDGTHIAFQWGYNEADRFYTDIFSVGLDGASPTRLTPADESSELSPAFSPDSSQIAYTAAVSPTEARVHTMMLDGTARTPLPNDVRAWSAGFVNPSLDWGTQATQPMPPTSPPSGFTLTSSQDAQEVGRTVTLTASGAGAAGTLVRFQVLNGPDKGITAVVAANVNGVSITSVRGRAQGVDDIRAWIDRNRNGRVEPSEPSGAVSVTWRVPPAQTNYVALGDSFSSGEGNAPFDAGTDESTNRCHRSADAWPRIASSSVWLVACSGAKIRDLYSPQYSSGPDAASGQIGQLRTIDRNLRREGRRVDVVTLMISGNDVGFSGLVKDCYGFATSCLENPEVYGARVRAQQLRVVLAIAAIKNAAPNARVILVGYPRALPATARQQTQCNWLSSTERSRVNTLTVNLDTMLKRAARQAGVRYVTTLDTLDGRELCTQTSWVFAVDPTIYGTDTRQAHPLRPWQEVVAALTRPLAS